MTGVASRALPGASDEAGGSPAGWASSSAVPPAVPAVPGVPVEVAAWVAAGRVALATGGCAHEWGAATRRAVLGELDRVERIVTSLRAQVVTAEREAGTWSLGGDRDLAGFLGSASHQGRGAGLAAVGQADTLAAMPAVAHALVDGPVTPRHLAELTRATAGSAALATELATDEGQQQVVELAGRLDGSEFGKALGQLSASLDPAARQRSHDEQRADRFLLLTHTPSGTLLKGRLDAIAGRELGKALDALSPRPAVDDDRSRQQRQADALTTMARRVLTDPHTTPDAVAPVQAVITFTQYTWTALRAARADAGDAAATPGSTLDVVDRLRGVDPVLDETGQPWPASEVARALCDCALTWAVAGTPGARLDLGRESRLFRRQHWLAMYAAGNRTCAVPGCGMPLAYTELHHIRWWQRDNGPTNPANCAPYCSFHHHEIHRLAIAITRTADGSLEHRHPDGRRYGAPPPDAGARSLPSDVVRPATEDEGHSRHDDDPPSATPTDADVGVGPPKAVHRAATPSAPAHAGGGEDPPPDLLALLSA